MNCYHCGSAFLLRSYDLIRQAETVCFICGRNQNPPQPDPTPPDRVYAMEKQLTNRVTYQRRRTR